MDYLFVPVGGGGLIAGCALAAQALSPFCRTIVIEPEAGDDATRSFRTKTLQLGVAPHQVFDVAGKAALVLGHAPKCRQSRVPKKENREGRNDEGGYADRQEATHVFKFR